MNRFGAVLLMLLLLAPAIAQDGNEELPGVEGPGIAVLVHHPYPDASDPFGFEYLDTGSDAYWHRYQHLDTDGVAGFDFPHTVFDGIVPIEGIPDGDGPYLATQAAYNAAFESRAATESPLDLWMARAVSDGTQIILVDAETAADLSGEDLNLWVALVEDPIHYEPPPALSNGVFVHPFVVRAAQNLGPLDDNRVQGSFEPPEGDAPAGWDVDRLLAVAWVQQGATDGLRFDAHEVVQAVIEDPESATGTKSTQKVVLMEMYSATWCDTCLFGDRVAEEMAVEQGIARDLEDIQTGYLRAVGWPLAVVAGILGGTLLAWPRLPGGKQ